MSNALDRCRSLLVPLPNAQGIYIRNDDLSLLIELAKLARPLTIIGDRWVSREEYNDHDAREFNAAIAALKQEAP